MWTRFKPKMEPTCAGLHADNREERKRVGEGRKVDEEAGVHRDSGRDNIRYTRKGRLRDREI